MKKKSLKRRNFIVIGRWYKSVIFSGSKACLKIWKLSLGEKDVWCRCSSKVMGSHPADTHTHIYAGTCCEMERDVQDGNVLHLGHPSAINARHCGVAGRERIEVLTFKPPWAHPTELKRGIQGGKVAMRRDERYRHIMCGYVCVWILNDISPACLCRYEASVQGENTTANVVRSSWWSLIVMEKQIVCVQNAIGSSSIKKNKENKGRSSTRVKNECV